MSYNLIVLEKSEVPVFYEDFIKWIENQTQWNEIWDYSSIYGTTPSLKSWFMEIKEIFPPLNGEFSLNNQEINSNKNIKNLLTNYNIKSNLIYATFDNSAVKEADHFVTQYAKKHQLGFYNPQTGEIDCDQIISCKFSTESITDMVAIWKQIEKQILTLPHRDEGFITVGFKNNGTDDEFMQSVPVPKPHKKKKFLYNPFSSKHNKNETEFTYIVEVGNGKQIYTKDVETVQEVCEIFHTYYTERKLPNLNNWVDSGIL